MKKWSSKVELHTPYSRRFTSKLLDPKTDHTGWWIAARAVGQIGGALAIPVLEESLKNNDPDIRSTAAKALEKIQQEANTPATPGSTQPMETIGELTRANSAAKGMESLPA